MTLFEMKEKLFALQNERKGIADWIAEKAADPNTSMEEINAKKAKMEELTSRIEILQKSHDEAEAEQRTAMAMQKGSGAGMTEKDVRIKAKANAYRALAGGDKGEISKAYSALGGIPALDADLGNGSKLLPTNMQNELIVEPVEENPMRSIMRVSNIRGLEEPKLIFDLDGAYDDITDKQTANEVELEGDTVAYGRHKVKVRAKISDTIVHGTDLNLVGEIESALRSGLATNELNRMFATNPANDYAGMSFYSSANNVKAVTGATKQAAIAKALADLPMTFRRNATIVMSATDWYDMWGTNLNQAGMFFEDRPLMLFGRKVVLVDDATEPVVGDFGYSRINYDIDTIMDVDKDVDAGIYKYVLTAWYDIKLRLKSAFRIARVQAAEGATGAGA